VQRRQIRRATELALLTPLLDRRIDDDDDEPVTGPIFVGGVENEPDEVAADDRFETPPGFQPVGAPIADTLTNRSIPRPWYRTKQTKIALIAGAVIAMTVSVVLVALRGSGTAPGESTTAVTSATPAPSSARLSPSSVAPTQPVVPPAPPPVPPPPPPPPAEQAPVVTGSNPWPRSQAPSPTEKPRIDVTRTPMSVAPPSIKPVPGTNSATPGDAPRRGWGFF
jgi:hypothetical protein